MPQTEVATSARNKLGDIALALVFAGWISAFMNFYSPLAVIGSILCPLGLILGLIALGRTPKRSASWAVGLGVLGQFAFVGTIWNELLLHFHS